MSNNIRWIAWKIKRKLHGNQPGFLEFWLLNEINDIMKSVFSLGHSLTDILLPTESCRVGKWSVVIISLPRCIVLSETGRDSVPYKFWKFHTKQYAISESWLRPQFCFVDLFPSKILLFHFYVQVARIVTSLSKERNLVKHHLKNQIEISIRTNIFHVIDATLARNVYLSGWA